ncbi:MAG: hypothetical protein ABSB15_27140 [Bryobacteraceae bacterium]|jgi:ElaB/YqjD/DUF883 family membrane-anchored ribosome-binding protein
MSTLTAQLDDLGHETAESLHGAASSIRRGSKTIDDLAESAAGKLDGAGTYVEKHNVKRTLAESRQLVRRYPAESLFVAAGLGFLTGFAVRRMTHACHKSAA